MTAGTVEMEERYLGRQLGYANKWWLGMPDEPQSLYEGEQRVITLRSRAAFAETRGLEITRRDNQTWIDRLKKAEMTALDRGLDIFRSQAVIRREILSIEQQLNPHSVRFAGTI